jgi:hypothetical protein
MQTRVTLQTTLRDAEIPNDDGKRDVYLDGRKKPNDNGSKSRICAVLDAVREATGGTAVARGGTLTLQWVSGMGFSGDPRNYVAQYIPPAMDLGGGQAAPQQAPPQQPQQANPWQGQQPPQQQPAPPQQPPAAPQAPPAQPPLQQPAAPAQAPQQAPAQGWTPEAIAALENAQVDPRTVYPNWTPPPGWQPPTPPQQ